MAEFRMPSLGADMDEGTLLEWRVKPGDTVHRGDVVAVVDTAKAAIEIETFEDGVVQGLLVQPGTSVPVGTPLAMIGPGAAAPAAARRPLVSPYARKRAAELGIDVGSVRVTGKVVHAVDVERAARAARPLPDRVPASARQKRPERPERPDAMRQAIAAAMARSKREIPHYYLATTIDLGRATAWLATANATRPVETRLVPAALLLKASALALRTTPDLNGFWVDGAFVPGTGIHVGVAIALRPSGLVAPAIHDADTLSLDELMAALVDLVRRARAGSLRQGEYTDPTVTVTNLGDQGVESVLGVIYPPQVALVGFGKVREAPWAERGLLGVRPVVTATLSGDHRASDGHRGARYLDTVADLLSRPEEL